MDELHSFQAGSTIISGRIQIPKHARIILILAHGAGAAYNHRFMDSLADQLVLLGVGVVRFNFPFTELKKSRPDSKEVAIATIGAVISEIRTRFPDHILIGSGKSFGGRMFSHFALHSTDLTALIFFGFPLHPADQPDIQRASHLPEITIPMLFLQGTKDKLAYPELLNKVTLPLQNTTLLYLDGAGHGFEKGKNFRTQELALSVQQWLIARQFT